MNDQTNQPGARPQRPRDDVSAAWHVYWQKLGQPWRTEPEIDEKRQEELANRRAITPDPTRGVYPFRDVRLERGDVEWLLATHQDGRGPVDWRDEKQRDRQGLDLRGADLRLVDLRNLPLASVLAGFLVGDGAVHLPTRLEGATLWGAHLEYAHLGFAHLEKAYFYFAHLQGATLFNAHLEGAYLHHAHLEGARLASAHLEGAYLGEAHLQGADLRQVYLEGATLFNAHLEGANLFFARLGGKDMDTDDLKRVRKYDAYFPDKLPPADLRGASFDARANLSSSTYLGDAEHGFPMLADVRWGGVNLAVVDWGPVVNNLGDEREVCRQETPLGQVKEKGRQLQDYQAAVRANRQLAVALREQGLNEVADRFAFRAQELQRKVLWMQRRTGQYLLSLFSSLIAGYGYRPSRTLTWYLAIIFVSMELYGLSGLGFSDSLVGSVTAFHGRGLFSTPLSGWQGAIASSEAVLGLIIEVAFIVTFTQRFFSR